MVSKRNQARQALGVTFVSDDPVTMPGYSHIAYIEYRRMISGPAGRTHTPPSRSRKHRRGGGR